MTMIPEKTMIVEFNASERGSLGLMSCDRKRFPEVDALRAFAVTLVVWVHTVRRDIFIRGYRVGGYHGVLLFFCYRWFSHYSNSARLTSRDHPECCALEHGASCVLHASFSSYFSDLLRSTLRCLCHGFPAVRQELGWHLTYLSNWYFAY